MVGERAAGWWIGALNCWGHFLVYILCIRLFIHQCDHLTDKATRNDATADATADYDSVTPKWFYDGYDAHNFSPQTSSVNIHGSFFAIFIFMIISRLTRLKWGLRIKQNQTFEVDFYNKKNSCT